MEYISLIIFLIFISFALQPMLQELLLARQRARQIAIIEKERGSRVITMIHRQETRASLIKSALMTQSRPLSLGGTFPPIASPQPA